VVAILAHQGGWDEVLFVAVPCAVFVWLLRLARKRSLAARDAEHAAAASEDAPTV
jgi:hypothetical protein